MPELVEDIAQQILDRSFAIADEVLPCKILHALMAEAVAEYQAGEFHRAEIGKGIEKQRIVEVRGDQVKWLDRSVATDAQQAYWDLLDSLRSYLSDFFRIHLERTEIHLAVYPKGAFYLPHLDQFREGGNRIFSVILYLNDGWKPGDGGELRIHHSDQSVEDIQPLFGRLAVFRSDEVLHEVLPANRLRVSVTGWMRKDPFLF